MIVKPVRPAQPFYRFLSPRWAMMPPPSWLMGDLALAARARGILYPSTLLRGGTNLAVFPQSLTPEDKVEPFDPSGELPRNQDSWSAR